MKTHLYPLFLVLPLLAICPSLGAQKAEVIPLKNPSFEDVPHIGIIDLEISPYGRLTTKPTEIKNWADCGFPDETPPDIHKSGGLEGAFEVKKESVEGNTFLGMVVRDNDTWESVSQDLPKPMVANTCYSCQIFLGRSERYLSRSRVNNQNANYTNPIVLRIWGGFENCDRRQLLAETPAIDHNDWRQYAMKLNPNRNYTHITIEAFYKTPTLFPYNGHLLVDAASDLVPVPCEEDATAQVEEQPASDLKLNESPSASEKSNPAPQASNQDQSVGMSRTSPERESTSKPPADRIMKQLDRANIKKGQIIRIEKLYFAADSARIEKSSYAALDEIYEFMRSNPDLTIEIGGHTNTIPGETFCNELSTERARAVVNYLLKKGIPEKQLTYKGYGKSKPVAPNDKYSKSARQKNQRVEIKILEITSQK